MLEYRECGLANVWLANGYRWVGSEADKRLSVESWEALHKAVQTAVATTYERLTGEEFSFLHSSQGLSAPDLADTFGLRAQTVAGWDRNGPPLWADRLVRSFHLERTGRTTRLWDVFDNDSRWGQFKSESEEPQRRTFEWCERDGWREAPFEVAKAAWERRNLAAESV